MKTIETEIRKDWDMISEKVTNLHKTDYLHITKRYLVLDLQECLKNYVRKYGIVYRPVDPPTN